MEDTGGHTTMAPCKREHPLNDDHKHQPPAPRPVLLYDGDCGFCRDRVRGLQNLVGDRVEFVPLEQGAARFAEIEPDDLREAVHLIQPDGRISRAAEAILRVRALAPSGGRLLWLYQKLPPFALASELVYRFTARHRATITRLTGATEEPDRRDRSNFVLARWVFIRCLALIYLIAFVSLGVQILGLVGKDGILPAADWLQRVEQAYPDWHRFWKVPTLFWIDASDAALTAVCWSGAGLSLLVFLRILPGPLLALLWVLYLSLTIAGQTFLSFQWDNLLLEAGFLAIFLAPWRLLPRLRSEPTPSVTVIWLLHWLLLRLMFCSGAVKLIHDHPIERSWRSLTALNYHYQTQPLPTWLGWYAHQLPEWFQQFSVATMLCIEIIVPFMIFAPRRWRHFAAMAFIFLQMLILATGNYTFFNTLTIALCLLLLDDRFLVRFFPKRIPTPSELAPTRLKRHWMRRIGVTSLAVAVVALSGIESARRLWPRSRLDALPGWMRSAASVHAPFRSINSYGLFTHMTTTRPEIVIEGSRDGREWLSYEFKFKPGDLTRRPAFVAPHQPRLDWQMWFAALNKYERQYWFRRFMGRLLVGAPDVVRLLHNNPFADDPPTYVRAMVYDYHFTNLQQRQETSAWWRREGKRAYSPVLSRRH